MSAVRILFWMFCIVVACGNWVFGGGVVGHERLLVPRNQPFASALDDQRIVQDDKAVRNDEASCDDRAKMVNIARAEIGVREVGNNSGKRVREYLGYTAIDVPAPWCASFVSWVYGHAGYKVPRTAWSPALFPKERVVEEVDGPGLIYGIYFPDLKRIGHCGIVEVIKGDWISGIEGNTNASGGRNGDGVYVRLRHKRTISVFANWKKPVNKGRGLE